MRTLLRACVLFGWLVLCIPSPAESQAPPGDGAGSLDEFRELWKGATRAKDAGALAALMDDQIVQLRGDFPPLVGREAVRAFAADMFSRIPGANPFEMYPLGSRVAESWALEYGEFGPTGGGRAGGYLLVLKRVEDRWVATVWKYGRAMRMP
ncbi:MAG TPA: nuclear transport factor 2 family protein [Longimicrobiaceae bacterium]|nr:nuclear transport factor 2 family protein [Longimicrobiaceae bacterium]